MAAGGENAVFRVEPYLPLEIIAKATLSKSPFNDLMLENHFIRLAYNETYICKLYEEIIACSEETKEILYLISIVESAENDLLQMCNAWVDPKMSEEKLDFFTPQKLEYFCVKTMKALNYLHKQNIYYGDMKP